MQIELNGSEILQVEDEWTSHGFRVVSSSHGTINPAPGYAAFVSCVERGSHPWVAYLTLDKDGNPELARNPATRMPLTKSVITRTS